MVKRKNKNKELLFNEEEAICLSSISSSLQGLLIILILTTALIINVWFFIGVVCMLFLYNAASFFANYLKMKDLIKKRDKDGKRKTIKK